MGEVALKTESGAVTPAVSDNAAVLSLIERLVLDPNVDVAKVERMFDLQERLLARNAEAAYNLAFAAMQPSLPEIDHKGKGNNDKTYAKWEDIHEKVTPVLTANGFGLSFRTSDAAGKIVVTAVLRHRDGHHDETSITLPSDQSGGKNAVQAVGSSVSYGKRYTACALLNIRTRGEDDDGKAASKKTTKHATGGSATQVGKDVRADIENGDEPGLQITDYTKDPDWDEYEQDLNNTCETRSDVDRWWKGHKAMKQRKPHFAKAFHQQVVLPVWNDLPEVPR